MIKNLTCAAFLKHCFTFYIKLIVSGENGTLAFVLMIAEGESELTFVKRSKRNFLMESHVKETQASKKSATCTIVLVIH